MDYLAHHDTLTGLPNRLLFHERLREAALHARQNNRIIALMFLDLDRFKIVNDTLGHTVGDELLAAVAERLRNSVRASDTVARLGGDEFAVVVSDMTDGSDIAHRAQKIIDTLSSAFSVGGNEVFVTTSIGITLFPNDNGEWSKMVENADVAMYHAKQQGRNNYQFYTAEMNACAYDQLMLETSLRHALERDEFVLYYQPQIDMPSGDIVGVEALIRWNHPELGLVPPNDFIPLLEVTGLIVPVGEWVIRTACRQVRTWLDEGHPPLTMAVNLSARQFREQNLKSNIAAILAETNIPANLLELEITESIVMENVQETVEILRQFKDMGLKVAIDDFGTGASSLSYLKSFPVDTLKISHDFVLNLPADNDDAAIAKAVITLARNMSLGSVAEGVETSEQMDFLRLQQCERMQGYLFSKALPPEQMAALLEERRRAAAT
ncbi:putative bifunctional diguanylate cyclase/phosphodiesterase [Methylogaea oryzae]|uniref:putative bifunctional diguanylate cyclase/phosphodiesterase n=1 Tax=Methylogaea oryzae TaxID=1295382 RepID=UPI0006CF71D2|nr:EAL domain-containing protein [Methylogaea oryzae]